MRQYENNSSSYSGGIGFFVALTLVFITLKLTGYIDWSWLWVLSPIWIPWTVFFVLLAVFMLLWLIAKGVTKLAE